MQLINLSGNKKLATKYTLKPYSSNRRQEVVAVPPVAASILDEPYLPPANADNELFIGPHGLPRPLQHGYPLFLGPHFFHPPSFGMYQEPVTGTLIPRPLIPPQYPGFMNPTAGGHGYHNTGLMSLEGHGTGFYRKNKLDYIYQSLTR